MIATMSLVIMAAVLLAGVVILLLENLNFKTMMTVFSKIGNWLYFIKHLFLVLILGTIVWFAERFFGAEPLDTSEDEYYF